MEEVSIQKSLWTIIILANCENNSFLYIEEIYNEICQNVLNENDLHSKDVNFIMLVDTPSVKVDLDIINKGYEFFKTRFAKLRKSQKFLAKQPGYHQFIEYENKKWDKVVEKYHSLLE